MNLTEAYLLLAVMLAVVAVVSVLFKGKSGLIAPLIFVAGLITALVAGLGFRLREVTEGPFVFVDTLMWVLCGAAFSYLLYVNGTFQFLFAKVVGKKRSPATQMFILILFIGLPGMITGTALGQRGHHWPDGWPLPAGQGDGEEQSGGGGDSGRSDGHAAASPVRTRHGPHHCPAGALSRRF